MTSQVESSGILPDSSKRPPLLPPCRICGEKASGFHYGANTCEACKGFFRRCLQRKEAYVCLKNSRCNIGPGQRRGCAYCRYSKCIDIGMSKKAIKTGRYTHAKRTQDILEVKQMKTSDGDSECHDPGVSKTDELEERANGVFYVHQKNMPSNSMLDKNLDSLHAAFREKKQWHEDIFGPMDSVTPEDFLKIYEATGLELDDRRQVLSAWFSFAETTLRKLINTCKEIHGFTDLHLDDQINLIKAGFQEFWIILGHKKFHKENTTFTVRNGLIVELCKIFGVEKAQNIIAVAERIKALQLTGRETANLQACCLFSPDRDFLLKPQKVEHYQMHYVEALQYVAQTDHPKDPQRIAKLIMILADLKSAAYFTPAAKSRIWTFVKSTNVPPLIKEMLVPPRPV